MADDVNKSGKPVNEYSRDPAKQEKTDYSKFGHRSTSEDPIKRAFAKIEATRVLNTKREQFIEERLGELSVKHSSPLYYDQADQLAETIKIYQAKKIDLSIAANQRAKEQLFTTVNSATAERRTRSAIAHASRSAQTVPLAIKMASTANPFGLQRVAGQLESEIHSSDESLRDAAARGDVEAVQGLSQRRNQLITRKGRVEATQGLMSKMGRDVSSQYLQAEKAVSQIDRRGLPKGLEDAEKALRRFVDTLEKGREVTKEEFEAKEIAIRQIEEHQEKREKFSRMISAAGQQAGSLGGGLVSLGQRAFIGTQIEGQQVATQFANWENRKFDDFRTGVRNLDFGAMRRLGGQYARAEGYGASLEDRQNAVIGAGGTVAAAAETMQSLGALAQERAVSGANYAAVIGHAGSAGLQLANMSVELNAGVRGGQTNMMGAEAIMQKFNAYSYVPDEIRNQAGRYRFGLGLATRGLGAGRDTAIASFEDVYTEGERTMSGTQRMAAIGINTQQAIQLTAQGVQALGGEFGGMQDIVQAGQAQRAGLLAAEDVVGLRGQLANVGDGSTQRIDKIMRTAVAAGMDNSKNIKQMVSATASLARDSAMLGVSTVSGVSKGIGLINQGLEGVPANIRTGVAQNAIQYANRTAQDQSMNIFNYAERAKLRGIPGVAGSQLTEEAAARLSVTEIMELQNISDPTKRAKAAGDLGLGRIVNAEGGELSDKTLKQLRHITNKQIVGVTLGGLHSSGDVNKTTTMFESKDFHERLRGGDLTEEEQRLYDQFRAGARISGVSGAAVAASMGEQELRQKQIQSNGQRSNYVERINEQQAKSTAFETDLGDIALGGADQAIKGTLELVESTNKKMEETGIAFFNKAEEAGKRFDRSDGVFSESVGVFKKAVDALMEKVMAGARSEEDTSAAVNDYITQRTGGIYIDQDTSRTKKGTRNR